LTDEYHIISEQDEANHESGTAAISDTGKKIKKGMDRYE
jgi:hypothetical protein